MIPEVHANVVLRTDVGDQSSLASQIQLGMLLHTRDRKAA